MKHKFLLTTIGIILCGTLCVAQNTISQAEYEKWVDYVNCKRFVAFIDNKIAQKSGEIGDKYKKDYAERQKSKLNVSLLDKAPKYNEIIKTIGDYPKAKMLSEYVNAKKNGLKQDWDKAQLINYLLDLPADKPSTDGNGFSGYLSNATNLLKKDLQNQIPDNLFQVKEKEVKQEQPKEEIWQTVEPTPTPEIRQTFYEEQEAVTEEISKQPTKSGSSFWTWFIWLCIIALIVALLYRFRKEWKEYLSQKFNSKPKTADKFVADKETKTPTKEKELGAENKRLLLNIKQWENDNAKLRTENQQLKNKVRELEQQVSELKNSRQQMPEVIPQAETKTETKMETSELRKSDKLYAANIIDGIFNKVTELPNDYSVFELTLLSQNTASFTVNSNAYSRVLVAPEFIEGCEKQILNDSPSNLEIEIGEAQYNNDSGKWKITKNAKIKFI